MSLHETYARVLSVRKRLLNPPNGRTSTELEIRTEPEMRKARIQIAINNDVKYQQAQAMQLKARQQRASDLMEEYKQKLAAWVVKGTPEPKEVEIPSLSMQQIINAVSKFYLIPVINIMSQRRTASVIRPRQIIMYLAREHTTLSFPVIGRRIGGRDHTTALHAHRKIAQLVGEGDEQIVADLAALRTNLGLA